MIFFLGDRLTINTLATRAAIALIDNIDVSHFSLYRRKNGRKCLKLIKHQSFRDRPFRE
ncbi:MAG: hypothetical protein GPI92_17885 [Microcystis aeruginosa K13-06]|nr:hypothetical protein [Microcystis aeruginosa K13-06]